MATRSMIFDIGNVLIYFNQEKMIEQLAELSGLTTVAITKELLTNGLGIKYETGLISTNELISYFEKISSRKHTKDAFKRAMSDIFKPNESLFPLVKTLKEKGIKLILLSNTSEIHFEYIHENYEIIGNFDHFILSFEVKAMKPAASIFKKAIEVSCCAPEECFYIDDIPEYINSARSLGIDAEQYVDTQTLIRQLSERNLIDSLSLY